MFYSACSRLNSCRLGSYLATWSGHVIVHMETDSGSAWLSNASLTANFIRFQWFFLYCLCLPILDCNVVTDYLALCSAYIFTFNVKARRSWRGGGGDHYEIQKHEWLWVS